MIKIEAIPNTVLEECDSLKNMAREALSFLQWHSWCKIVKQGYLDIGWPGILAIFYFEIEPASASADDTLWVVVGDIPPAYIDTVSCPTAALALSGYLNAMQEWMDHISTQQPVDNLIPVYRRHSLLRMPPTRESAQLLQTRLDFIRTQLLPICES